MTGAGVKVAIMDTGIDYHHPDLGGCFGLGCRVAMGYDFVGDTFTGSNTPVPDLYPDDCNGHCTHVAGIVGAVIENDGPSERELRTVAGFNLHVSIPIQGDDRRGL